MISSQKLTASVLSFLCAVALLLLPVQVMAEKEAARSFSIEAGDASRTLAVFAEQARVQVVYLVDQVGGVRTNRLSGVHKAGDALRLLLQGTSLVSERDARTGTLVVRPSAVPPASEGKHSAPDERAAIAGTISGSVSSQQTRNYLEGATVEIPALGLRTLTDRDGRFFFQNVPLGDALLRARYTGLEAQERTVRVVPEGAAGVEFSLDSEVMQLAQFVVQSEREGQAQAINAQRNAGNVKNVVALDAYGNLPNLSAGELASRLAGVAPLLDNEDNITGVAIRGSAPGMNRVTVDGNLIANSAGYSRGFQMHSMTGAMFEELELIKGQTPDRSADSVGGGINLRTRSPLKLKERRRVSYNFAGRWAAPFLHDYTPIRRQHALHPLLNLAYQEVFDAFGGSRNLGVSLNVFYSENINSPDQIQLDYQNTAEQPAYVWDYRTLTRYGYRKQASVNLKTEYRFSPNTKVIANVIVNDANEPANREFTSRAYANQTVAALDASGQPTGTGAILPSYDGAITQVRAVAGSSFELATVLQSFFNRTRMLQLGAEHQFPRLLVEYDASFSMAHANLGHGDDSQGGSLVMRMAPVGWRLDTSDPRRPVMVQTAGASLYDAANYRTLVQNTLRDQDRDVDLWTARLDATYKAEAGFPLTFKAGGTYRNHFVAERVRDRRWSYTHAAPLPAGIDPWTANEERMGRALPFVDPAKIRSQMGDASLWTEDVYYGASQKFSASSEATEEIAAGYAMGQARFGRLGVIAGVRTEVTWVEGFGYVRVSPATAAQIPDPVERARHDWDNPRTNDGRYTRSFPSAHFTYDITENLKARASWSTSFGRPDFSNLVPSATINAALATVTVNNPAVGPQYATNIDASLEYYFKPAGLLSVGYFHKDIKDYIVLTEIGVVGAGPDNGYNGDYSGYTLQSRTNAGDAKVRGWEFDYRQQLTFLPGALRGLTVSANYTCLSTEGDFGGGSRLTTNEVAGFIPKTANGSLNYKFGRLSARVLASYTGSYLGTTAALQQRRIYRKARTTVNVGVSYEVRPSLSLFCDVTNVLNAAQETYRGYPDRLERTVTNGPALTFGVNGKF